MLTNKIKVDVLPKKPAYYGRARVFEEETYAEETGVDSTHEDTNSSLIWSNAFSSLLHVCIDDLESSYNEIFHMNWFTKLSESIRSTMNWLTISLNQYISADLNVFL